MALPGTARKVLDHAQATPVTLRYAGAALHTSQNGHLLAAYLLAAQLEQLVAHWPTPVQAGVQHISAVAGRALTPVGV